MCSNGQGLPEQDLLDKRIIKVFGIFDEDLKDDIITCIVHLLAVDERKEITLLIDSDGGQLDTLSAIYDLMKLSGVKYNTIVLSHAYSAGAILASLGTKGYRYSFPSARLMLHKCFVRVDGEFEAKDFFNEGERFVKYSHKPVMKMLQDSTGKTIKELEEDLTEDKFFTVQEAISYGVIDEELSSKEFKRIFKTNMYYEKPQRKKKGAENEIIL